MNLILTLVKRSKQSYFTKFYQVYVENLKNNIMGIKRHFTKTPKLHMF